MTDPARETEAERFEALAHPLNGSLADLDFVGLEYEQPAALRKQLALLLHNFHFRSLDIADQGELGESESLRNLAEFDLRHCDRRAVRFHPARQHVVAHIEWAVVVGDRSVDDREARSLP